MNKDPQIIVDQIIQLVSELATLAGASVGSASEEAKACPRQEPKIKTGGATGGIRLLAQEGKFDSPRQMAEIKELLKQECRHYPRSTIAMALTLLVKERVLVRFKDGAGKGWKYAVRR